MLPNVRPAWLSEGSRQHVEDEQDMALLEEEMKGEFDMAFTDAIPRPSRWSRLAQLCRLDEAQIDNLKPAWLRQKKERKLHPTSYLDGLRGVAAFCVFIHHSSLALFPQIRPGYGASPGGLYAVNHNYIIQLPVLRLFYSGAAMVTIFFVISGYVLSTKPLRLAREGEHQKLFDSLASSAFRRGPRLYIPCLVSTFITALVSILGVPLNHGITRNYPKSATGSWYEQFSVWFRDTLQFWNPFSPGTGFEPNLWTIPIEFRGSLLVFLVALGVSKIKRTMMRTALLALLALYWLHMGYWELVLFLGGMLVADFTLYRQEKPNHRMAMKVVHGALILFCVYLLSMPEENEGIATSSFGYSVFHNALTPSNWYGHAPPGRFWVTIAAVLLVATMEHAGADSIYQRTFTTGIAQYLGDISFSFYLWHGLCIFTVGARVMTYMLSIAGAEGSGWWVALIVTEIVMVPTLLWVADLSTVFVDKAAIKFAKRLMEL